MRQCDYISWVGRYHDGELDEQRAAELERHLRQCGECSAELDELQRMSQALRLEASPPVISAAAVQRLHGHVEQLSAVSDQSLRRFAELLSGLAAALLIISSLWLLRAPQASAEPVASWENAAAVLQVGNLTPGSEPLTAARWIVTELQQPPRQRR